MFTINSNYKKILFKVSIIFSIFFIINAVLFIYIRDYSIGYRPLDTKAKALFQMYPNPKVIVGGDSTAECGIDPLILDPSSVNISTPGAGMASFVKALKFYHPDPFTKDNVIVVNFGVLTLNDRVINFEKYITVIDDFLMVGPFYLLKQWGSHFFNNLFSIYQCKFSSCRFYLDRAYPDIYSTSSHGFRPTMAMFNTIKDKRDYFDKIYFDYLKDIQVRGVLLDAYKKNLSMLVKTNANVIILHLPFSEELKKHNQYFTSNQFKLFISDVQKECSKYSNCTFLDYINWNNLNIGKDENKIFSDLTHLTPEAANNFSRILKNDIYLALKRNGDHAH